MSLHLADAEAITDAPGAARRVSALHAGALDGQLDLFAELDAPQAAVARADAQRRFDEAPALFDTGQRGYFARITAAAEWSEQHGHFDCLRRSHAWRAKIGAGDKHPTAQFRPTTLTADLRCEHHRSGCNCVGELVYRGACLHCNWEGPLRASHNSAVEDAHDHARPGWRDVPRVPRRPDAAGSPAKQKTALARWANTINKVYPDTWLASGGPIRTQRKPYGTRHVPDHTGFGGYDLAVPPVNERDKAEP